MSNDGAVSPRSGSGLLTGRLSWSSVPSLAAGLLVWEAASRLSWLNPQLFPAPTQVLHELGRLAQTAPFYTNLFATLWRVAAGFLLGAVLGVFGGILCGSRRFIGSVLEPWVHATYPLPVLAFIPLFMLVLGVGDALCVGVIALSVFYPVFILSRTGIAQVDGSLLDAARNLGADRFQLLTEVTLPAMCPYLFAGAYQGLMRAVLMAVVVEALVAFQGLGKMLWISGEWLKTDAYFAYLFVLAALGLLALGLLRQTARLFAPWALEPLGREPDQDG